MPDDLARPIAATAAAIDGDCEPVFVDCPAPGACTADSCPCLEGALGDLDDDEWWDGGAPPGRDCVDVIRDLSDYQEGAAS